MASSLERIPEIIRDAERDFDRDDLDEVRAILARERDLDLVHSATEGAFEAIHLLVSDPLYRGDLTLAELEGPPASPREAAQRIIDALLDR